MRQTMGRAATISGSTRPEVASDKQAGSYLIRPGADRRRIGRLANTK
jgi:hypothetical protein